MSAQNIRNLLDVFDRATTPRYADAIASYARYNELLWEIAKQTGRRPGVACGVFSALSPNNNYVQNLKDTVTLLAAYASGGEMDAFKVCTYGANKRKAWRIAEGEDPDEVLTGLKTNAFYHNCKAPNSPDHVTIDGHIWCAWIGKKHRLQGRNKTTESVPTIGRKLYEEIADCIRLVAEIKGVVPCQAQAVIWQEWRIMHGVQGARQMELLARDAFAAGVPDHPLVYSGCGQ